MIFKGFQRHKQMVSSCSWERLITKICDSGQFHVWLSAIQLHVTLKMDDPNDFHSVRLWCCVTIVTFEGKRDKSSGIRVGMFVSMSNERQLDWGAIYCFSQAASATWSLPVVFSCCLALAFLCCPSRFALRFVLLRKMSKQIISETTQFHPRYKSNERERRSDYSWDVVGVSRRPL